jgi:hypothetical protein
MSKKLAELILLVDFLLEDRRQVDEIAKDMQIFLRRHIKSVSQLDYIIDLILIYVPSVFFDYLKSLDDESNDSNVVVVVVVVDVVLHLN